MKKLFIFFLSLFLAFILIFSFISSADIEDKGFYDDDPETTDPDTSSTKSTGVWSSITQGISKLFSRASSEISSGGTSLTSRQKALQDYNLQSSVFNEMYYTKDNQLGSFVNSHKYAFTLDELNSLKEGETKGEEIRAILETPADLQSSPIGISSKEDLNLADIEKAISEYHTQWDSITYGEEDKFGLGKELKEFVDQNAKAFTQSQLTAIRGENLIFGRWNQDEGKDIYARLISNKQLAEKSDGIGTKIRNFVSKIPIIGGILGGSWNVVETKWFEIFGLSRSIIGFFFGVIYFYWGFLFYKKENIILKVMTIFNRLNQRINTYVFELIGKAIGFCGAIVLGLIWSGIYFGTANIPLLGVILYWPLKLLGGSVIGFLFGLILNPLWIYAIPATIDNIFRGAKRQKIVNYFKKTKKQAQRGAEGAEAVEAAVESG